MRLTKQDLSYTYFEECLNQLNLIYVLHMFIFVKGYELWVRELMSRIWATTTLWVERIYLNSFIIS
jgi:hypothetical protein